MANSWDPIVGTIPYTDNLERLAAYARSRGYILNPDEERMKKVVGLMTMNKEQHGDYYCPCKQSHPLKKEDVLCPCPRIDEEISKDGNCFCKLFFRKA